MIFDTHSHLNFRAYNDDRDEIIKQCLAQEIWHINVGSNLATSRIAVSLAGKYEKGVYSSVGLHPIHLGTSLVKVKKDDNEEENLNQEANFDYEEYKKLAQSNNVVAIGETGLDYYWRPKTTKRLTDFKENQKKLLAKHIQLANELNLPVIFHCRMAHNDLIKLLEGQNNTTGVIHCFTGTWEQAQKYLDMGLLLGFNGIIFKFDVDEVIKKIPLEKILIETDCPYLSPPGYKERNDPMGVELVAKRMAEIKDIDLQKLVEQTVGNALKLFRISATSFDKDV